MIILESAHRHAVSADDMLHAIEHHGLVFDQADGSIMYIGPARPGHPILEVGVIEWYGVLAINHAMKAQRKYQSR